MCAIYDNGIKRIAKAYEVELSQKGIEFFNMIAEYKSIRGCLLALYSIMVKEGRCLPIEKLPDEEKRRLWMEAKTYTNNKAEAVEICRALHGFGSFIQT